MIRILSIDGGGVRGIIPALFLSHVDLSGLDAVVGTSVGSGLGAMVASGKDPSDILDSFEDLDHGVFRNRLFRRINPFLTSYSPRDLRNTLDRLFDFPVGQLNIPYFATSLRFCEDPSPRMFDRSDDWKVSEICMASMSAPTYFPPFRKDGIYWVDGGLWANNPSVAGAFSVKHKMKVPFTDIRMLSMGTGNPGPRCTSDPSRWTLLTWGKHLISYITEGNVMASSFGAPLMGMGWYRRFLGPLRAPSWSLDHVSGMDDMLMASKPLIDEFKRIWDEFMS